MKGWISLLYFTLDLHYIVSKYTKETFLNKLYGHIYFYILFNS